MIIQGDQGKPEAHSPIVLLSFIFILIFILLISILLIPIHVHPCAHLHHAWTSLRVMRPTFGKEFELRDTRRDRIELIRGELVEMRVNDLVLYTDRRALDLEERLITCQYLERWSARVIYISR